MYWHWSTTSVFVLTVQLYWGGSIPGTFLQLQMVQRAGPSPLSSNLTCDPTMSEDKENVALICSLKYTCFFFNCVVCYRLMCFKCDFAMSKENENVALIYSLKYPGFFFHCVQSVIVWCDLCATLRCLRNRKRSNIAKLMCCIFLMSNSLCFIERPHDA